MKFVTTTGKDLDEVRKLLDAPLPDEAYKKIGGQALDLTDISPAWTRRALTSIFGLFGFGWGMNHDGADVELTFETKANGKTAADVAIKRAKFWYVLMDEENKPHVFSFTTTGSGRNEQGNGGWALKGAMTNALSTAASFIGFQESVYMGVRSHNDTKAQATRSGMSIDPAKTLEPERSEVPGADPTSVGAPSANGSSSDSAASAPSGTQAPPPVDPNKGKVMRHFACDKCAAVASEYAPIPACKKCGFDKFKEYPTLAAAKRHTPNIPHEPPAETTQLAGSDQPCMACGSVVPVTPTCPDCGSDTITTDTKALTAEMNRLTNKDRAVLLRRASKVSGRTIKGYSEMSVDDLRALVYDLRVTPYTAEESAAAKGTNSVTPAAATPAPTAPVAPASSPPAGGNGTGNGVATQGHASSGAAPAKMSKVQLIKAIFEAGDKIGIASASAILAELSTRWNRVLKSSADLTVDELEISLKEFQGVNP